MDNNFFWVGAQPTGTECAAEFPTCGDLSSKSRASNLEVFAMKLEEYTQGNFANEKR